MIKAELVKELREKTGAGMMDCKKALEAVEGELEQAIDWLRKKGLSAAAKKASRVASEGLVTVCTAPTRGVAVEVNAETDFVARNEQFQSFVRTLGQLCLQHKGDIETLKKLSYPGTRRTVEEELTQLIATIGENMTLRRAESLEVTEGVVVSYIHAKAAPDLGRIGVLVSLESKGDQKVLEEVGEQLAMHVAAARPEALRREDISPQTLEREKEILREQALASGKPADVVEKMMDGRVRKYFEEVVLMDQVFAIDGKTKITALLEESAKKAGAPIELTGFIRFALGEGIEKKATDFAAEVAAQLG